MMIAVPGPAARHPSPERGLKNAMLSVFGFDLLYVFAVRFIYPHLP